MQIRIGYEIEFEQKEAVPYVTLLKVRPEETSKLTLPEEYRVSPSLHVHDFSDGFGNRCSRFLAPAGKFSLSFENILEHDGLPDLYVPDAIQHPIEDLPDEALPYLLGSRYCEVDELIPIAWELFGNTKPGWERVQAICDRVHSHVTYDYGRTHPRKTAKQVYEDGGGVCRDFQHLAVTFCRCMNVPARYVSGFLGDIQFEPIPTPMDFHAWFQVYLGGMWFDFDARHNVPRVGRIAMTHGRDAVDVALTTSFGVSTLTKFEIIAEEV